MAILQVVQMSQMAVGVVPLEWRILTNDTLAQVTTTGYLSTQQIRYNFHNNDFAFVTTSDLGVVMLNITVSSAGVVSLVDTADSQVISYPVIANHIAVFTSTSNSASLLGDDAPTAINGGNIQAGLSGTAGALISYPAVSSKGSFVVSATANTGNTLTTLTNAPMGQASVITLPDPGASTASVVLNTGANTMVSGSTLALAKGIGTEAANAVTINQQAGVITTSSLATAAGATYTITLTNSKITTASVILLSLMGGSNTTKNIQLGAVPGSGTATIVINNNNGSSALNGTLILGFAVL